MSRLTVADKGVIFRNPLPGHRVVNAFYPEILCLTDREWLCAMRVAAALYSPDGQVEIFRTRDAGATWDREGPVRPRGRDAVHYNEFEGLISRLRDGSLVVRMMRADHSNPDILAFNPDTGGLMPMEASFHRSTDNGKTWSDPVVAELRPHFGPTVEAVPMGRILELEDGAWFHTFETWKTYENGGPFDLNIYGMTSRDGGRTWTDKIPVAVGTPHNRSYSHAIGIRLHDGRIFLGAWTAVPQLQTSFELHGVVSADASAHSWEKPFPLGIPGQTNCAAELSPNRMVMAYSHRDGTEQPGIKAVLSEDGGRTWSVDAPVILWDAYGKESLGVAKSSTYPSSHDAIAYGAPKITRLNDTTAIASFWCTQGGDTHTRWCRIEIG